FTDLHGSCSRPSRHGDLLSGPDPDFCKRGNFHGTSVSNRCGHTECRDPEAAAAGTADHRGHCPSVFRHDDQSSGTGSRGSGKQLVGYFEKYDVCRTVHSHTEWASVTRNEISVQGINPKHLNVISHAFGYKC